MYLDGSMRGRGLYHETHVVESGNWKISYDLSFAASVVYYQFTLPYCSHISSTDT